MDQNPENPNLEPDKNQLPRLTKLEKLAKIMINLLELLSGSDKTPSVCISVIVIIGHLILLSIIEEFDVK